MFGLFAGFARNGAIAKLKKFEIDFKTKLNELDKLRKLQLQNEKHGKGEQQRKLAELEEFISMHSQELDHKADQKYAEGKVKLIDREIDELKEVIANTKAKKDVILSSSVAKTLYKRYCHYKHYIPKAYKHLDEMAMLLKAHFLSEDLKKATNSNISMVIARVKYAKNIVEEIKSFYDYVEAASSVDRKMSRQYDRLHELEIERLYYDRFYVAHHADLSLVAQRFSVQADRMLSPQDTLGNMLYKAVCDLSLLDHKDYFLSSLRRHHLNYIKRLIKAGASFNVNVNKNSFNIMECEEIHHPNALAARSLIIRFNPYSSDVVIEKAVASSRKFYNYDIVVDICKQYIRSEDAFRVAMNTGHFEVATQLLDSFPRLNQNLKDYISSAMTKKFMSELNQDIKLFNQLKADYKSEYNKVKKFFDENEYFMEGYKLLAGFEEGIVSVNNINYDKLLETATRVYFEFLANDKINYFIEYRSRVLNQAKSLEHRHTLMLKLNELSEEKLLSGTETKGSNAISGLGISLA